MYTIDKWNYHCLKQEVTLWKTFKVWRHYKFAISQNIKHIIFWSPKLIV